MKMEVKFPCGYEMTIETGLKDMFNLYDLPDKCPIHGKNCKR